jgi:hypothetical protein
LQNPQCYQRDCIRLKSVPAKKAIIRVKKEPTEWGVFSTCSSENGLIFRWDTEHKNLNSKRQIIKLVNVQINCKNSPEKKKHREPL